MKLHPHLRRKARRSPQQGYVLIVMLLFLALMVIGLTAAAPAMATRVRREREIELIHRGKQYARAIRLFYRKFGRYPVRLEELEKTNNIRFLRKRYKDPMTASGDWRLIHYGEAQLTRPTLVRCFPERHTPGSPTTPGSSGTAAVGGSSSPFANTFSSGSQSSSGQTSTATPSPTGTGQAGAAAGTSADSSQSGQAGQSGQPGQPGHAGFATQFALGKRTPIRRRTLGGRGQHEQERVHQGTQQEKPLQRLGVRLRPELWI